MELHSDHDIRIDSGVAEGDAISPYYDPMIAKMIAYGDTREQALRRLGRALENSRIAGCVTNLGFLHRLTCLSDFQSGQIETGLISKRSADLHVDSEPSMAVLACAGFYFSGCLDSGTDAVLTPWRHYRHWRPWGRANIRLRLVHRQQHIDLDISLCHAKKAGFNVENQQFTARIIAFDSHSCKIRIDGKDSELSVFPQCGTVYIFQGIDSFQFEVADPIHNSQGMSATEENIASPMPGTITQLLVAEGGQVEAEQVLVVMEAMKMEHSLKASRSGTVSAVHCQVKDQVDAGTVLIQLSESE